MILLVLAFLGGVLTIASPCILPVLPFVFTQVDRPFSRGTLPLLLGMAAAFAVVGSLAAFAGGWAVAANQVGRLAALLLLGLFGISLLFAGVADRLTRPLVRLGERLSSTPEGAGEPGPGRAVLLGVATGLLWAPCAGPILGLILTGAALQGASVETTLLLLAYAAGAATALALALLAGKRVFAAMKRSIGAGQWLRRALGAAVLASVAAIALGLDTGALTRLSVASTTRIEQELLDKLHPGAARPDARVIAMASNARALPVEGTAPPLAGAQEWLNSAPLAGDALKGRVVLVNFWTYSCSNCLRSLPYLRAWAEKYKDQGLVVVGVHAPEFAFERDAANVKKAVADLKIGYPVAIDNQFAIWRAYGNQAWPARYLVDAQGRIREQHFGEGSYRETEWAIQQLLAEAGAGVKGADYVLPQGEGTTHAADPRNLRSPESYIGYKQADSFQSEGGAVRDRPRDYRVPARLALNQWGLAGNWTIAGEFATLNNKEGAIVHRFHARDLHLVVGPGPDGKPLRFRVTIDGAAPGASHGTDTDANGEGVIREQRLYQLVRQSGEVKDRTFEIRFLDPGAQAYAFTFG
jgi:cytochrome c biogenesis protein CcdA/thiol-disulfide isomerase/thioredoxin